MKYNININQKAIIDLGLNLDVVDLAIFDFIKDFSNSSACLKVVIGGKQYFWISHSKVISELPMIKIATRQGVFKRISKLVDSELIERIDVDPQKSYYCFGRNYDNVTFVADRKQSFTLDVNENLRLPVNNGLHNYNTTNHNINDNKEHHDFSDLEEINSIKKPSKRNKKETPADLIFFRESKWNNYETLKSKLLEDEDFKKAFKGVDLKAYIEDVLYWSEKGNQSTNEGWYMTIRRWIREAKKKGTMHMLPVSEKKENNDLFYNP